MLSNKIPRFTKTISVQSGLIYRGIDIRQSISAFRV